MNNQNQFPYDGLVRLPKVIAFLGIGKSTLWAWVKNGSFPKPIKIGRVTAWKAEDVRNFIEAGGRV